jgi:SAM-dependent methyltransferase
VRSDFDHGKYNTIFGRSSSTVVAEIHTIKDLLERVTVNLGNWVGEEPPIEEPYMRWREFYAARQLHYAEIVKELGEHGDAYSEWYKSGGYGYDPRQSRIWLINETSLADFRGTCLDIGSGDGFWSWLLSEWYHVTGIDPVAGGVEVANVIKRRLPLTIQRRVEFIVGDALDAQNQYDVVFCRAPSFSTTRFIDRSNRRCSIPTEGGCARCG